MHFPLAQKKNLESEVVTLRPRVRSHHAILEVFRSQSDISSQLPWLLRLGVSRMDKSSKEPTTIIFVYLTNFPTHIKKFSRQKRGLINRGPQNENCGANPREPVSCFRQWSFRQSRKPARYGNLVYMHTRFNKTMISESQDLENKIYQSADCTVCLNQDLIRHLSTCRMFSAGTLISQNAWTNFCGIIKL